MLMLCLRIACIHVLSVKALPEPSLESSVICTLLFVLAQRKETIMGKVQILAVLTMDGCQSSELCCKAYKELRLEDCGINKIRENALYHITPDYSISMLDEWRKSTTDICYLAEVTPERRTTSTGCCVCVWWMKSYFTRFLSLPERESVSSSPPCHRDNGR